MGPREAKGHRECPPGAPLQPELESAALILEGAVGGAEPSVNTGVLLHQQQGPWGSTFTGSLARRPALSSSILLSRRASFSVYCFVLKLGMEELDSMVHTNHMHPLSPSHSPLRTSPAPRVETPDRFTGLASSLRKQPTPAQQ